MFGFRSNMGRNPIFRIRFFFIRIKRVRIRIRVSVLFFNPSPEKFIRFGSGPRSKSGPLTPLPNSMAGWSNWKLIISSNGSMKSNSPIYTSWKVHSIKKQWTTERRLVGLFALSLPKMFGQLLSLYRKMQELCYFAYDEELINVIL